MHTRAALLVYALLASGAVTGQEPTPPLSGPEQVDSGTVINYEEGRNVVIRRPDGTQAIYPVASNINWPPELRMSGWVNVYFELLEGGAFHVTRLTTVLLSPTAAPATPTQTATPIPTHSLPPTAAPTPKMERTARKGAPVRLSMANAVTVVSIEPGRLLTVRGSDGTTRTYLLDESSQLPPRLSVKQKVIVETREQDGAQVVRRVVYPEIKISNVSK